MRGGGGHGLKRAELKLQGEGSVDLNSVSWFSLSVLKGQKKLLVNLNPVLNQVLGQ